MDEDEDIVYNEATIAERIMRMVRIVRTSTLWILI